VSRGNKYFSGDVSSILVKNLRKSGEVKSNDAIPSVSKEVKIEKGNPFDLTKRENQILNLAVSGMTNKDIASTLDISKRTTEVHRFNLMKKMDVKNVLELSKKARKFNMIP